jgi:predicted GIY-YIG superfamily endonuclease
MTTNSSVLRLSLGKQALRDAVCRGNLRPREAGIRGFTARYRVDTLVWFETHDSVEAAIRREQQIKEWKREWKFNLIERDNPRWVDLYPNLEP